MTESVQVTFVIPKHCKSENDCTEEMLIAYSACNNHQGGGLRAQWVHESSLKLDPVPQKKHIFVLSEFEGETFEQLKSTNCMLIGPRCLSCCLTEGSSIPSKGHPVFTVAMRGLVVTTTGLAKDVKAKVQLKIEWMGGSYSSVLTDATTHLISNNVFSDKYIKATERGIPVMRESWVDAVWEASLKQDVNGSSTSFDCYRLPPFANLQITTSGLSQHDKKQIMKLINSNGGEFSRAFQSQTTDVLVLTKNNLGSEKCKAAIEYGKVCVTPHWIKDSAALGFALPVSRYQICTASTSSPIAANRLPDMSLNFSRISKVGGTNNFGNEPPTTNVQVLSESTKIQHDLKKDTSSTDEIQQAFESFDLANIKKAGPIFDGLCVWVTGLEGVARERAAACVSRGGGVRYDGPHERVTHVVAGAAAAAAAAALPAVPVLSPLWLLRSVEAGRLLDEREFVLNALPATPNKEFRAPPEAASPHMERRAPPQAASPMSRRNLQLLRACRASPPPQPPPLPPPPPPPPPPGDESGDQIVNHYLSQTLTQSEATTFLEPDDKPANSNEFVNQSECTESDIFKDMVIEVQGLEEAAVCEIEREIRAAGGVLAAAGAGGARALVPLDFDVARLRTPAADPVTVFWVKDCLSQQALVPVEYYHRPVRVRAAGAAPLRGVVASLSTYTGVERAFLAELAKLLGATTQQRFCRRDTASALASTHLICPEASGAKYAGAVKWGVPAVRADWLLACAAAGARVPEAAHAVDAPPGPSTVRSLDDLQQLTDDTVCSTLATPKKGNSEEKENLNNNSKVLFQEKLEDKLKEQKEVMEGKPETVAGEKPEDILRKKPEKKLQEMLEEMRKEKPSTAEKHAAAAPGARRADKDRQQSENSKLEEDGNDRDCTIKSPCAADVLLTPNLRRLSPSTRRRLQAVKRGEMLFDPIRTPNNPFEKKTPDSTIGGQLRPCRKRMSIDARKHLWEFVNNLPASNGLLGDNDDTPLTYEYEPPLGQPHKSESCSEEKNARKFDVQDLADDTPPKKAKLTENQCAGGAAAAAQVSEQLQLLSSTLTGRRTPRAARARSCATRSGNDVEYDSGPESQPNTVGWDDTTPSQRDLNISGQISELKRVKSAPSEMIPASKDPDLRKNTTDPIHHNTKDNIEDILRAVETAKIDVDEVPEYERARNTTEISSCNSPPKNQGVECQDMKENQCPKNNDEMPNSPNTLKLSRVVKRFIVSSNVDNREETVEMIARLGGTVTDLEEGAPATHLLCAMPARSQRILSSIAAGCWVLHPAYVARSAAAGAFLPEESFEWGNPLATWLPAAAGGEAALARAAHRWRARRAAGAPPPFAGHAVLLHVPVARRCLLARFICAGGGTVVDQQPPYTDESITVCFADPKRCPVSSRDREWLRARRVPVCAPILLSAVLTDDEQPDLRAHCLPDFRPPA